MERAYIGIDPGSKGFLVLMHRYELVDSCSIEDDGIEGVVGFLEKWYGADTAVVVEDPRQIVGGVSSTSNFKFGYNVGMIIGVLRGLGISYTQVPPQKWQREIWTAADKVYKPLKEGRKTRQVDTKATSILACKRLFPKCDLRRTAKCKNPDDNKVDAMLIAEYGRRMNL